LAFLFPPLDKAQIFYLVEVNKPGKPPWGSCGLLGRFYFIPHKRDDNWLH
jgi:hypothetical protein